jgi:hypothetical protein
MAKIINFPAKENRTMRPKRCQPSRNISGIIDYDANRFFVEVVKRVLNENEPEFQSEFDEDEMFSAWSILSGAIEHYVYDCEPYSTSLHKAFSRGLDNKYIEFQNETNLKEYVEMKLKQMQHGEPIRCAKIKHQYVFFGMFE